MKYILLILLISCSSFERSKPIEKPPELDSIIEEVEESEELKKSAPEIQKRIVHKLKESQEYNEIAYAKVMELEERLNKLEERNRALEEENKELREELSTWRTVKAGMIFLIVGLIITFIGSQVWRFRKLLGSPI